MAGCELVEPWIGADQRVAPVPTSNAYSRVSVPALACTAYTSPYAVDGFGANDTRLCHHQRYPEVASYAPIPPPPVLSAILSVTAASPPPPGSVAVQRYAPVCSS